jgi:hypothetical protein
MCAVASSLGGLNHAAAGNLSTARYSSACRLLGPNRKHLLDLEHYRV